MVLAGKIFILPEETDLGISAAKLKETLLEEKIENMVLLTEIKNFQVTSTSLEGIFMQDTLLDVRHHGTPVRVPVTLEAPFIISRYKARHFLIVIEKKTRANTIANHLSKLFFLTPGRITEAHIPPHVFREFHNANFEDTKVIFFDEVNLPNITKLSLYGSALGNTALYADHLNHGEIWYIVLKSKKTGLIVGVTRHCVVTLFSKASRDDLFAFIKGEIFPLIP